MSMEHKPHECSMDKRCPLCGGKVAHTTAETIVYKCHTRYSEETFTQSPKCREHEIKHGR